MVSQFKSVLPHKHLPETFICCSQVEVWQRDEEDGGRDEQVQVKLIFNLKMFKLIEQHILDTNAVQQLS
jgi:hypothetical protein